MADPCIRCHGPRGSVSKAGGSPVCEACGVAAEELADGVRNERRRAA